MADTEQEAVTSSQESVRECFEIQTLKGFLAKRVHNLLASETFSGHERTGVGAYCSPFIDH
jgi:hypothetical protein